MKEKNRVIIAAWVMLSLLTAAVAASAALTLWSSQYGAQFSGFISVENMEHYAAYMKTVTAQDTLEAVSLLAGVIAYPVMLACHVSGNKPLPSKQKWVYTGITAAALLVPSLVMGLCDPINDLFAYYLFTPVALVGVLVACVVLEYGLKALQKRKDKKQ